MIAFSRLSLSRRFLVASFPVLLLGMLVIGVWVAREIEQGVVNRLGSVTGLYVDSLVAPHLRRLLDADALDPQRRQMLDALLTDTPLGRKIIAFNIWRPDGRVLYSTNASIIGNSFPVGEGLATALRGEVYSKIIERSEFEHGPADDRWPPRLIETYTPVHTLATGEIIGSAEFYQTTDELMRESNAAQRRSWLIVAATMVVMYLLLFGLVRRGSQTIEIQREQLRDRVAELLTLVERNTQLDAKVRGAAAQTTAINERYLRRISSDLHDGPGQDLGFALMRLDSIARSHECAPASADSSCNLRGELDTVRSGLESGLADLRAISAGLRLPDISKLSNYDIAARAVRDYERKAGASVILTTEGYAGETALPVKITLYRLLQESLANGFRHAGGVDQRVRLSQAEDYLSVEIADGGPGFDPVKASTSGGIGLAGMRERVRALGGIFELHVTPGQGTVINATLPVRVPGGDDE